MRGGACRRELPSGSADGVKAGLPGRGQEQRIKTEAAKAGKAQGKEGQLGGTVTPQTQGRLGPEPSRSGTVRGGVWRCAPWAEQAPLRKTVSLGPAVPQGPCDRGPPAPPQGGNASPGSTSLALCPAGPLTCSGCYGVRSTLLGMGRNHPTPSWCPPDHGQHHTLMMFL